MTTVSSLYVRILGDASGLQSTLARSSASIKGFSTGAQASTGAVTKSAVGMTAAFIGIAAAAKAAADFTAFEATMTRTVTLAGATEESMKAASAEILNVASSLGKGPQELAEALYFTQSAGIDASKAMDVVTVAAKASAVGLGETQVVADALTSVINAYGAENITAARAADILTAAVREGKGEADAIAGAIGRVIPIASEMGVEFEEVAGGIAAMTRTGLDANEAVTALRGALAAMLNPTDQARELLDSVGVSVQSLQADIASQGLLPTLTDLQARFEGNDEAFGTLFGNIRAQTGVLSLLGANAGEVGQVFRDVAASGGTLEEAFARVQETSEFKLQQALASVQVALVEVGGALAPLVKGAAGLLTVIGPLLPALVALGAAILLIRAVVAATVWVNALSGSLAIMGTAAVNAGRTLTVTGSLVSAANAAWSGLGTGIASSIAGFAKFGLVAGATFGLFKLVTGVIGDATADFTELGKQTGVNARLLDWVSGRMDLAGAAFEGGHTSLTGFIASLDGVQDQMPEVAAAMGEVGAQFEDFGVTARDVNGLLAENARLLDGTDSGIRAMTEAGEAQLDYIRQYVGYLEKGELSQGEFVAGLAQIGIGTRSAFQIADEALGKHGKTLTATGKVVANFLNLTTEGLKALQVSYRGMFSTVDDVLTSLSEKHKLTAGDILEAFRKQNRALTDYETNVEAVVKRGAPDEVLDQLATLGIDGARIVEQLANANDRQFDRIITQMAKAAAAADRITNAYTRIPEQVTTTITTVFETHGSPSRVQVHTGGLIMHGGGQAAIKADEVPAILQRGEFVLRRSAVQKIGVPALSAMNRMHEGGFAGTNQSIETGSISILAAAMERAVTNAIGNTSNQNGNSGGDGGILALLRHKADIASLFTLMGTTVHRFATEAQKALKPDQWQEFSRAMNDALRSDDWRAFADQIREAVGPKVWKKMVDDARKAFESGNLKFISATIKDALRVEEWQAFARSVRQDATAALESFHDAAVSALSFADTALSELTSAASQAAAELKGGTDLTGQALFRLRQDAKLTGFDILKAFQRSAKETRAFGRDLLEISKIGGQAGKDLAASLLASGDVLAAQTIANAPRQLQVDIAHAFSEAGKAADKFANKLTASIAGTLKDIEKILKAIAKDWDINLNLNADRHHSGGLIASDEVPAILQKGEYVIRKSAVNRVGVDTLAAINRLHEGGSADGLRMLRDLAPMQPAPAAAKVNVTVALPKPADVNLRVSPDRRQFGRSMDYADMTDGRFS